MDLVSFIFNWRINVDLFPLYLRNHELKQRLEGREIASVSLVIFKICTSKISHMVDNICLIWKKVPWPNILQSHLVEKLILMRYSSIVPSQTVPTSTTWNRTDLAILTGTTYSAISTRRTLQLSKLDK